jgi:uncharacterized protein (DUF1330 family)
MAAYFIANYTVTDPEMYREYQGKVMPTLIASGAKILVVGHSDVISEGEPQAQTIVLEFESLEVAQNWYNSPEYQAIINLRLDASEGGFGVFAEQFVMPNS